MNKRTKILYLSASPRDQQRQQSDLEFRQIFEQLDPEYFEISSRSKMKAADLISALTEKQPHILHFSGHGSNEEIIFEDAAEKSRRVQKRDVIEVFQHLSKRPRIVFLNACWTAENLEELGQVIDFVIATRRKVFDSVAIDFAAKFYELLGNGQPVRNAFNLTRKQFDIDGTKDRVEMYELLIGNDAGKGKMVKRSSTGKKEAPSETPGVGPVILNNENGTIRDTNLAVGNNNTMNIKR
jgi:hypothetical protein